MAKRVFIVHGHDLKLRDEVSAYVRSLGLEPVVLVDLPNQGNTVIEKLERGASTSEYAIILLTSDDVGGSHDTVDQALVKDVDAVRYKVRYQLSALPAITEYDKVIADAKALLQPRARQNVILELGLFIGRMGRKQVCVLAAPDVEQPSDILGVVTISTADDWKSALRKELQAVGIV